MGLAGALRSARREHEQTVLIVLLTAGLAMPLVVALIVLHDPRWYPSLEIAQTEMHVRAVASSHPPLVGLVGRIGQSPEGGNHPGPLSFWTLWPIYRIAGSRAWALQVATVGVHLIASSILLWIAGRRGGRPLTLAVAIALAVLLRAYGSQVMTEPWNPFLPIVWWMIVLLAAWSVVEGDLALLPVLAFAGSFVAQTHVSYVALVSGLAALAVTLALVGARRRGGAAVASAARWTAVAAFVTVIVWMPPIIEELTTSPGNLTVLWRFFTDPPEDPIGARRGLSLMLTHMNPSRLLGGTLIESRVRATGSAVLGGWLIGVWGICALISVRRRHDRRLASLNCIIAVALVIGWMSASRVFGRLHSWLVLWAWGIAVMMLAAIAWTAVLLVRGRWSMQPDRRAMRITTFAAAAAFIVPVVAVGFDATRTEDFWGDHTGPVSRVIEPTVHAIESGAVPGGGLDGRYLVTWTDPFFLGMHGWTVLNELDRAGITVGVEATTGAAMPRHRHMTRRDATGEVHLALGSTIETWRAEPGFVQVAIVDERTPAERLEQIRARKRLVDSLERFGRSDLVRVVDDNPIALELDTRLPWEVHEAAHRYVSFGAAVAMFVGPADVPRSE